jgi:hypothetical protein
MLAWVRRFRDDVGDSYVLGLVRSLLGVLLFWQAFDAARRYGEMGYFGDAFHLPFVPEAWVPTRRAYLAILSARLVGAALVVVGHRARPALFACAILGFYTLLCDRLDFHHNRYTLYCFALLVALGPCDRAFAITRGASTVASRTGPLWAQRLAQAQLSLVYLASGGSKLLDPDWRDGLVIGDRFMRYAGDAIAKGVPQRVIDLFSRPIMTSGLAKLAIATEVFLAFALWTRRTRIFALWWGVMFHLTIEVSSHVEIFTWLTLTIYALFASPDVRARKIFFDPSRAKGVFCGRAIRALDWLARFEVRPWEPDALKKGHVMVLIRRDGSRATGIRALAMVTRSVPLLFPLWAPVALVASFTRGGEVESRA